MPRGESQHIAIFRGAIIGGVIASLVNLGIYFGASAFGADLMVMHPSSDTPQPIPIMMPVFGTLFISMAAAFILTTLLRYAPRVYWRVFLTLTLGTCALLVWLCTSALHGDNPLAAMCTAAMLVLGSAITSMAIFHTQRNS